DGQRCMCLRCREVRGNGAAAGELTLDNLVYPAAQSTEHFLSFNTSDDKLAGYLRLSLPAAAAELGLDELEGAAIVREVHVYGAALPLGAGSTNNTAQHSGLGKRLLAAAERIASTHGYTRLAVIAAIGTREYYRRAGFELCGSYMLRTLPAAAG
ncbi:MAG: GNAT family N-acetyltransferase, partial [Chloroflexi bacterium]|nr:GNAT family N-acetyltransferase [Chloroflexota bacterium]